MRGRGVVVGRSVLSNRSGDIDRYIAVAIRCDGGRVGIAINRSEITQCGIGQCYVAAIKTGDVFTEFKGDREGAVGRGGFALNIHCRCSRIIGHGHLRCGVVVVSTGVLSTGGWYIDGHVAAAIGCDGGGVSITIDCSKVADTGIGQDNITGREATDGLIELEGHLIRAIYSSGCSLNCDIRGGVVVNNIYLARGCIRVARRVLC